MTTTIEETTTRAAADLRLELSAAREALSPASAAVTDARAAYQAALDAEATGRAEEGSALRARQDLSDAEHAEDLAKAKVRVLEREAQEAEEHEAELRRGEIAAEIAAVNDAAGDLSARLCATVDRLLALLHEGDEVNARGGRLTTELRALGTEGRGYSARRVNVSLEVKRRLAPVMERRGSPREAAVFVP